MKAKLYVVAGVNFLSRRQAVSFAKELCACHRSRVSVWEDGNNEAVETFCWSNEGSGKVFRATKEFRVQ